MGEGAADPGQRLGLHSPALLVPLAAHPVPDVFECGDHSGRLAFGIADRRHLHDRLDPGAVRGAQNPLVLRGGSAGMGSHVRADPRPVLGPPPRQRRPRADEIGAGEAGEPAERLVHLDHALVAIEPNQPVLDRPQDCLRLPALAVQGSRALLDPLLQVQVGIRQGRNCCLPFGQYRRDQPGSGDRDEA